MKTNKGGSPMIDRTEETGLTDRQEKALDWLVEVRTKIDRYTRFWQPSGVLDKLIEHLSVAARELGRADEAAGYPTGGAEAPDASDTIDQLRKDNECAQRENTRLKQEVFALKELLEAEREYSAGLVAVADEFQSRIQAALRP